jgi:signal transduction histidine kinase
MSRSSSALEPISLHRITPGYFQVRSPVERLNLTGETRVDELAGRTLECVPQAALVVDHADIILFANSEAERVFGYPKGAIAGQRLEQLLPGAVPKRHGSRQDGSRFGADVVARRLESADGAVTILFVRDVTAAERAESERNRLGRERALHEDANRLKDEFLAVLSHELRTPMNSIIGWTSVLRSSVAENPETMRALDIIQRNARTLVRLIEDLLDVSRIVSGHLRIDLRQVDLSALAGGVVDNLRVTAEAKSLTLTFSSLTPSAPVTGDPDRLQQVVLNLLSNAVKFTPAGGSVQVSVERAGDRVRLQVKDSGTGIAPDFLPQVFDRFRRADSSSTRSHSGLGLGLAIVRSVVELHRGTVRAESAGIGHGATFTVDLPVAQDERPA